MLEENFRLKKRLQPCLGGPFVCKLFFSINRHERTFSKILWSIPRVLFFFSGVNLTENGHIVRRRKIWKKIISVGLFFPAALCQKTWSFHWICYSANSYSSLSPSLRSFCPADADAPGELLSPGASAADGADGWCRIFDLQRDLDAFSLAGVRSGGRPAHRRFNAEFSQRRRCRPFFRRRLQLDIAGLESGRGAGFGLPFPRRRWIADGSTAPQPSWR